MGILRKFSSVLIFSFLLFSIYPSSVSDLSQGMLSFKNEDWASAVFFLKKYIGESSFSEVGDDISYILLRSEINSENLEEAQADCEVFLRSFPESRYKQLVNFQNGKLLHLLGKNEAAVISLCDFCQASPDSELYPDALYWIAECFFDEYDFESAKGLYTRIVSDFSSNNKCSDSKYKLDLINRRSREEKLLYLLKVTGEENLSARDDYERQLKIYKLEERAGFNKQLKEAQNRVSDLENVVDNLKNDSNNESNSDNLHNENVNVKSENDNVFETENNIFENTIYDVSDNVVESFDYDDELDKLRKKMRLIQKKMQEN